MASKTILFLGLVFALVLLISSDVVSARTDPAAAAETKSVQPEGWHHEEHHHHYCHGHHCDEKDKKEGEDEDEAEADDHKKKRCKHWPHC